MLDIGTAIEALKYGATAKIDAGGDAYRKTVQGSIIRGPSGVTAYSDLFASKETSDTNQETYVTYGLPPQVRKWSGESSYGDAPEYAVTVVNEEWWVGVEIHERVLRRNQLGKPLIRVQALGEEALRFFDARALSVILATDASVFPFAYGPKSGTAYTKPLISATHVKGPTTQSNYLNSALTGATLATAIQNFMSLTDFQGQRPIGSSPGMLLVGPAVLVTAIDAVMGALRVVTAGDGATGNPIVQFGLGLAAVLHTVPTDFAALVDNRNPDDMPVLVQMEKDWEQRDNMDNPSDPVRRNEGGRIQISLDSAGECAPWAALRIYRIK